MTAVAVATKTTTMLIISFVARYAGCRCFIYRGVLMAAFTGHALMGAIQRKIGVVMIVVPQHPAIGIMTITA